MTLPGMLQNEPSIFVFQNVASCFIEGNERSFSAGITNDLGLRMNKHMSSCRLGTSSDKFYNHVFKCRAENSNCLEPILNICTAPSTHPPP